MKWKIGTLYGDDSGDGSIKFTDEFKADTALYRADVLQVILHELTAAYNEAVDEMYSDFTRARCAQKPGDTLDQ